jgi:protein-L-isoaspartate(D-aspartate) O-methyltransferase
MVRSLEAKGIAHPLVLRAMASVPRECFVEEALRARAYAELALPIGDGQSVSQPAVVARMTELLEPDGTGRVLEIGTGSGYHAAVLAYLFEQVYTVERIASLSHRARAIVRSLGIENVHFKIFDGSFGWSEFAPYRGIVVTAAAPEVPAPLLQQLRDGGILVLPVARTGPGSSKAGAQTLWKVVRRGEGFAFEDHGPCRFVPLVGRFGWAS